MAVLPNSYGSESYRSGGVSFYEGEAAPSVLENFGRLWNNLNGTTANNAFNSAEAEKNRQWQTEMSNTAYQRAAADMKAAGINPASLGGNSTMAPASTPGGSAAHASASGGSGFIGVLMDAYKGALYQRVMRSALSSKEGIAAANRESRENIAELNSLSREKIALDKSIQRQGEHADNLSQRQKELDWRKEEYRDKLEVKLAELENRQEMFNITTNLKRDIASAQKADREFKRALEQEKWVDSHEYHKYRGKNEHLTWIERMEGKKGRNG